MRIKALLVLMGLSLSYSVAASDIEFSIYEGTAPCSVNKSSSGDIKQGLTVNEEHYKEKIKVKMPVDNRGNFQVSVSALSEVLDITGSLHADKKQKFLTKFNVKLSSHTGDSSLATTLLLTNGEEVIAGGLSTCDMTATAKGRDNTSSKSSVIKVKLL